MTHPPLHFVFLDAATTGPATFTPCLQNGLCRAFLIQPLAFANLVKEDPPLKKPQYALPFSQETVSGLCPD
jgi:hypothetical protein